MSSSEVERQVGGKVQLCAPERPAIPPEASPINKLDDVM